MNFPMEYVFDFGSLCVVKSLLLRFLEIFWDTFWDASLEAFLGFFLAILGTIFLDDFLDDIFGYGSLCIVQILLYWHPLPQDFG